jgi:hypothetical protein
MMGFGAEANLTKTFENSLDKLKSVMNQNDFEIVEPLLGEYFTYGSFNCGSGCSAPRMAMEYIIKDYPYEVSRLLSMRSSMILPNTVLQPLSILRTEPPIRKS